MGCASRGRLISSGNDLVARADHHIGGLEGQTRRVLLVSPMSVSGKSEVHIAQDPEKPQSALFQDGHGP